MIFTPSTVAALIIAISVAAGLNVYATVLTLGLLARAHWVVLPAGLEMLADPWMIAVSGLLFTAEFFAGKVPGLDLIWNALHTFIRIPVAALLAYGASTHLPPRMQLVAIVAGAAIALAAHSSKTAARVVINASPEPFSNIAFSLGEDTASIGITWLATRHPWTAAAAALVFLLLMAFAIRWIIKMLRSLFGAAPRQTA